MQNRDTDEKEDEMKLLESKRKKTGGEQEKNIAVLARI